MKGGGAAYFEFFLKKHLESLPRRVLHIVRALIYLCLIVEVTLAEHG